MANLSQANTQEKTILMISEKFKHTEIGENDYRKFKHTKLGETKRTKNDFQNWIYSQKPPLQENKKIRGSPTTKSSTKSIAKSKQTRQPSSHNWAGESMLY